VASGGDGAVGGRSGGAVGGDGGVGVGSWPAVGEVAGGAEDVILVGKRGGGARGWCGGGPLEKARLPSGTWRRYTGRRGGALADDGGALVEVDRALLEDGGLVGGAAAVRDDGGARWENLAA
jgi:hypothetical protein